MGRARRIAIVGAGPIGLEAALFARLSGYDVTVYERGTVGENVKNWGHVRLFSPFGLNASSWGREALLRHGREMPGDEDLLKGREFAERYLIPLAELPELYGCLNERTEVVSVGRSRQLKQDRIGTPARGETPFRILVSNKNGERSDEADVVLDCSGTYPHHNWLGTGGIPCPGEREFLSSKNYRLPDVLGKDRDRFAGRLTLVVGAGYSAATSIVAIAELAESVPDTKAVWLTRQPEIAPVDEVLDDPLVERERLAIRANQLAMAERGPIDWRPVAEVQAVSKTANGRFNVVACDPQSKPRAIIVDEVLAHVGYRPDRSIYDELQVHECYASQGPMKLAAALLGESSADCLAQTSHGPESLRNPEPGFFILGSKSYGRNSRFLLKIGIEQIRDVFTLISATT